MSIQAMVWAIEQPIKEAGAKLVLVCVANYADKKGVCWPSQETVGKDATMTDRTVRRWLKWLEENKYLTREPQYEHGKRTSDLIVLDLAGSYRKNFPVENEATGKNGSDLPESSGQTYRKHVSGEPSIEPSMNRQRGARKRACSLPDDWTPDEQAIRWAADNGFDRDTVLTETDKFVDYWKAKGGKDGRKADWTATWRNWLRRSAEYKASRPPAKQSTHERLRSAMASVLAENDGGGLPGSGEGRYDAPDAGPIIDGVAVDLEDEPSTDASDERGTDGGSGLALFGFPPSER